MSIVDESIEVRAPAADVWGVVSDPRNLPTWDRHVVSVKGVPPAGLRKGSTYQVTVRFMGARASATAKVLEWDSPRHARIRVHGLIEATVESWVEPVDGDRTRLRHRIVYRFPGGPLGELAATATKLLGARAIVQRGLLAQRRQAEERR